jgi:hypothetical protein
MANRWLLSGRHHNNARKQEAADTERHQGQVELRDECLKPTKTVGFCFLRAHLNNSIVTGKQAQAKVSSKEASDR